MNHLTEIITTLADRGVKFIVCGGVAAVLQGVERMSPGLDLSVSRVPGNMGNMQYENLTPGAEMVRIENRQVAVLSRRKKELKEKIQPARDKDIFDIKALRKLTERDSD